MICKPVWVSVGDETFRSFINTGQTQTVVGWMVATKASVFYKARRELTRQEDGIISEILVPIRIQDTIRAIKCRIINEPEDVITLGWDVLQCFGHTITIGGLPPLQGSGCCSVLHENMYDVALRASIENVPIPPRTPNCPRNPINLTLYDTPENEDSNVKNSNSQKSDAKENTCTEGDALEKHMSWADEADRLDERLRQEGHVAVLDQNEDELEEYLRNNSDLN